MQSTPGRAKGKKDLSLITTGGSPTSLSSLMSWMPGTQYDYKREAGNLWENSIVLLCLKWQERVFPEARVCVETLDRSGEWVQDFTHPVLRLLHQPNDFDTWADLSSAILLALTIDGNAYLHKLRDITGEVVGLEWMPFWAVAPKGSDDGTKRVEKYLYRWRGKTIELDPCDVIHFRDGKDPKSPLRGLSPLSALYREVCTDNEALTYKAALMRNMGINPVVFTPKNDEVDITRDKADEIIDRLMDKSTGERRGEPAILTEPMDMHQVALSPDDLSVELMHEVAEERIPGAIGVQPVVVGLGAGIENSNNRASFEAAVKQSWEQGIIPRQRILADRLTLDLLSERGYGDKKTAGVTVRITWDLSRVAALQEDRNALFERYRDDWEAGAITRDQYLKATGRTEVDGKPVYIYDVMPNRGQKPQDAAPKPITPPTSQDK